MPPNDDITQALLTVADKAINIAWHAIATHGTQTTARIAGADHELAY